jgi:hypothetical protein
MRQALWITAMAGFIASLTPADLYAQAERALPEKDAAKEAAASPEGDAPRDEAAPPEGDAASAGDAAAAEETGPAGDPMPENTLEECQDGADNDLDQHVDCDDQDCEIFAVCIEEAEAEEEAPAAAAPVVLPERGWQCRDGIDNDENGKADCHDESCQYSRYCKTVMYERPEPKNKAPGVFITLGFGLAMPNFRMPTAETEIPGQDEIPFDPDMGLMLDLQAGYLFLKFLGAGLNLKSAFTFATNSDRYFFDNDDPDDYKYTGSKYYGNLGAFVRLQWPFPRIVPYLNIHVGYSVSRYKWHIYDAENYWSDIYDFEADDSEYIYGDRYERNIGRSRHFTFALEPGFDVLAVRRLFGIGIRAWLPVAANEHASRDNIGILLNFTFTPMWREKPRLKAEYQSRQEK